jgi:hypothetical protein
LACDIALDPVADAANLLSVPDQNPRPLGAGLAALVAANLAVALLAVLREWGYYETLLIYWLEAVVIGGYNVLRLLVVGLRGEQPLGAWLSRSVGMTPGARLFVTLLGTGFFVVKFGGFALVVGLFVITLPATFVTAGESGGAAVFRGLEAAGPGVAVAVGLLILSHGISFVRNFLLGREYARLSVVGLIFWPYARMALVALVLGLGLLIAGLRPGLQGTTTFAVVMVLAKLAADVVSHLTEHRWLGARAAPTPAPEPT